MISLSHVSWSTIDARSNNLYIYIDWNGFEHYEKVSVPKMTYTGITFADALQLAMNEAMNTEIKFDVLYGLNDNMITIKRRDQPGANV